MTYFHPNMRRLVSATLATLVMLPMLSLSSLVYASGISEVQNNAAAQNFGANTLAFNASVSAGDLLVATVYAYACTAGQVSDNVNGNWTLVPSSDITDPHNDHLSTWYVANAAAGTTTVTVGNSSGDPCGNYWISIAEFSGVATSTPVDLVASNAPSGTSTASSVSTASNVAAGELSWGATIWYNFGPTTIAGTSGSGWTSTNYGTNYNYQYQLSAPGGAVSTMSTTSSVTANFATELVTFKPGTGGSGGGSTTGITNRDIQLTGLIIALIIAFFTIRAFRFRGEA